MYSFICYNEVRTYIMKDKKKEKKKAVEVKNKKEEKEEYSNLKQKVMTEEFDPSILDDEE